MIQRVQTIYLLLVIAVLALGIFLPIATLGVSEGETYQIDSFGFVMSGKNQIKFPTLWLIIPAILMAILTIMVFKNRKTQIRFLRINFLLLLATSVLSFVYFYQFKNASSNLFGVNFAMNYGFGLFLPIAALVFNFLALRGVKHDENLVKSLDRLR